MDEFCVFENSDINRLTYLQWENGRNTGISKVGVRKVLARANQLGIYASFEWIMCGTGQFPVPNEAFDGSSENEKRVLALAEKLDFLKDETGFVKLTLPDNSMSPEYQKYDWVAGIKLSDLSRAQGLDCIVQTVEGDLVLRRVDASDKPGRVVLRCQSTHPDYKTLYEVKLVMAAPVMHRFRGAL
jgi:hypothetical protein